MQPEQRDAAYLWDMLDACQAICQFTVGLGFEDYAASRQVQFAVERALEIVGEAAHRVSDSFRQAHPEVRWASIIGQPNVLAHEYGAIKHDRIWVVATVHVPDLVDKLQRWLPPAPPVSEA